MLAGTIAVAGLFFHAAGAIPDHDSAGIIGIGVDNSHHGDQRQEAAEITT